MNFLFNVNFWGEKYTRLFLDYSLPSQLAEGNIPNMLLHNQGTIKYFIYTTREDAALVLASPVYVKLCELVEAEMVYLENFDTYNGHFRGTMTLCHSHAIEYANANNYSLLFVWPDAIYSCNSFGTLCNLALSGKTTAFVGSLTVHTWRFLDELQNNYTLVDGALNLPPRELIAIGVRNLAMQSEHWMWDSPYFDVHPSWVFWKAPSEGLLQRAFHLTPILLTPDDRSITLTYDSIDELGLDGTDYVSRALHDISSVHVIEDSDDFLAISLNDVVLPTVPNKFSVFDVAVYAASAIFFPYHRSFFNYKFRYHCANLSPEWEKIEEYTDQVAHKILDLCKIIKLFPELLTVYNERKAAVKEKQELIHAASAVLVKQNFQIAEGLNELGRLQFEVGRKNLAIDKFTEAIDVAPEHPDAYLNLARLFAQQGDHLQAFKLIHKVLKINPQNNEAIILANENINGQQTDNYP